MRNIGILLIVALSVSLLSSCNKMTEELSGRRVEFRLVGRESKSSISENEEGVTSLSLLAFNSVGGAVCCNVTEPVSGSGDPSISHVLPSGSVVDWYILANVPASRLSGIASKTAFFERVATLSDQASTGPSMFASGHLYVDPDGVAPVPVMLSRHACKVSIGTLSVPWMDSFVTPPVISVGRIVLVNVVAGSMLYGSPASSGDWYNKMGIDAGTPSGIAGLLVRDYGGLQVGGASDVKTLAGSLYCMPNPTSNGANSINAPQWSVRNTRFALELIVDGVSNWYPVDLPGMVCNGHYVIESFAVLGPGSDSPDKPVSRSDISFSVYVLPWDELPVDISFNDD